MPVILRAAVAETRALHHQVDGRSQLLANHLVGHVLAGHHDHGFETRESVARRVGVDGGHGAVVARVHGLQHVERFGAARFAHDDAVGPHTQRIDHQIARRDGARAFDVGRARFKAHHVRLLQLQFGGVFDGDDALVFRNEARHGVEHGRLAGARTAGDHDVQARFHAAAEKVENAVRERLVLQQIFGGQQLLAVAPDGERPGPMSESGGITAQTREPSSRRASTMGDESSMRAADVRNDAVDNHAQMRLIPEADVGFDQPAAALDVHVVEAVDHDVGDGVVLQQRFERAEAEDFVLNFFDDAFALGHRHRDAFVDDQPFDEIADLRAHAVFVQRLQLLGRERVEQLEMNLAS